MSNSIKIGKILWWCSKNENGIITDSDGLEFYFDRSVLSLTKRQKVERGSLVIFEPSRVDSILAARNVSIPMARNRKKYELKYEQDKNQLKLPFELGSSCQAS